MSTTRRSFLTMMGLAATGMAFKSALPSATDWLVPESLIAYDGPVSFDWVSAEALAILAANLPYRRLKHYSNPSKMFSGSHHLGVNIPLYDEDLQLTRKEVRDRIIEPAMVAMAQEIDYRNPSNCIALEIPRAVERGSRIVNDRHGLNLRMIRAYDMCESQTVTRFDILVA